MTADSNEKDNQIARATTNIIIDTINSSPIAERKRLLIVDDEPDITSVLRRGLEQYGFAVDTFNDAVETLSHFKVGYYDLLLLDISMPKMNGFELGKQVKTEYPRLPVIYMSAYAIEKAIKCARELRNSRVPEDCAFLTKPFSEEELEQFRQSGEGCSLAEFWRKMGVS